jgi:uridine kinase
MDLGALVSTIMKRPGPLRFVAIDGPGGSGKSTFASQLSAAARGAPIIHTDDFATPDHPIDWSPNLLEKAMNPLLRGETARYQRFDWPTLKMAEWCTIEPAPIVIIEGVTAGRSEWREHLSFLIWVETPRDERLRRGLERDGIETLPIWDAWIPAEDAHYERDPTRPRADLVIDGTA